MRQARGRDVDAREGLVDLGDVEDCELGAGRDVMQERFEWFTRQDGDEGGLDGLEKGLLDPEDAMDTVMAMRHGSEGRMFKFRTGRRKKRSENWEEADDQWEFVRDPWDSREAGVDVDWEILSIHSAPN